MRYVHPKRIWRKCAYKLQNYIFPLIHNVCVVIRHPFFHINRKCGYLYSEAGGGNVIICNSQLPNLTVQLNGHNNVVKIGKNVTMGKWCDIHVIGDNITVEIGDGCTFGHQCKFFARENGSKIILGEDCMFGAQITVRNSDGHPIYNLETGERINKFGNIVISDHVWIAHQAYILKGVNIGNNAIIGARAVVTKDIPCNSIAVGSPCKIVKDNVKWERVMSKEEMNWGGEQKDTRVYL